MAWPDMDDIAELVHYGREIRALCVITWDADGIRPWVTAMEPDIVGDGSDWEDLSLDLDPIVVEALKSMTDMVNHNNTISAGFEKDVVVSAILALDDANIPMDANVMQGWGSCSWVGWRQPETSSRVRQEHQRWEAPAH